MGDHQTGYSKLAHSSIPRVRTGASGYRAQLTSSFQSLTPSPSETRALIHAQPPAEIVQYPSSPRSEISGTPSVGWGIA
ncbi:hypothetical protein CfB38_7017 (plasmid) [Citrobacter freundii]|nr:hypothetical protein CfB38_7017 [Citrobacter freundii]